MSASPRWPLAVTLAIGGALAGFAALQRGRPDVAAAQSPITEFDVTDYLVQGMVGSLSARG